MTLKFDLHILQWLDSNFRKLSKTAAEISAVDGHNIVTFYLFDWNAKEPTVTLLTENVRRSGL